tara:strand:- start:301 stop:540 length:240 start_codon:yes stop_codon:yes gene_type:complete
MNVQVIFDNIETALKNPPGNQFTAEMHLQMSKYVDSLKSITAKEFCQGAGLKGSFGNECSKMRNLIQRLKSEDLYTDSL